MGAHKAATKKSGQTAAAVRLNEADWGKPPDLPPRILPRRRDLNEEGPPETVRCERPFPETVMRLLSIQLTVNPFGRSRFPLTTEPARSRLARSRARAVCSSQGTP